MKKKYIAPVASLIIIKSATRLLSASGNGDGGAKAYSFSDSPDESTAAPTDRDSNLWEE